uniref:hypothetical protein n=1 Tax=Klebsiella aerogenes TaxID=548 RepID=UPI001953B9FA
IKLPGLDASVIPSSAPSALGTGIGAALAGGNVELAARLGQGPAIRPLPTVEAPLFQGFRVNAPMRPSTVDVAFSTDPPEPDY